MISEKELRAELKRYPMFMKNAYKDKRYQELLELEISMNTIEWILSEND